MGWKQWWAASWRGFVEQHQPACPHRCYRCRYQSRSLRLEQRPLIHLEPCRQLIFHGLVYGPWDKVILTLSNLVNSTFQLDYLEKTKGVFLCSNSPCLVYCGNRPVALTEQNVLLRVWCHNFLSRCTLKFQEGFGITLNLPNPSQPVEELPPSPTIRTTVRVEQRVHSTTMPMPEWTRRRGRMRVTWWRNCSQRMSLRQTISLSGASPHSTPWRFTLQLTVSIAEDIVKDLIFSWVSRLWQRQPARMGFTLFLRAWMSKMEYKTGIKYAMKWSKFVRSLCTMTNSYQR